MLYAIWMLNKKKISDIQVSLEHLIPVSLANCSVQISGKYRSLQPVAACQKTGSNCSNILHPPSKVLQTFQQILRRNKQKKKINHQPPLFLSSSHFLHSYLSQNRNLDRLSNIHPPAKHLSLLHGKTGSIISLCCVVCVYMCIPALSLPLPFEPSVRRH